MSRKFTVPIVLPADPTNPLEATTKQYTDLMKEVYVGKFGPSPPHTYKLWADGSGIYAWDTTLQSWYALSVAPNEVYYSNVAPTSGQEDLWVDITVPTSPILKMNAGGTWVPVASGSRLINTTTPLSGGGDLTADRTFAWLPTANVDMAGFKFTGLSNNASLPGDSVNLQYLNNRLSGLSWKQPCVAATTGNVTLSGLGQTIDGVVVSGVARVLVKNQTNPQENGIYLTGTPWTRDTDMILASHVYGAATYITGGTTQDNTLWAVTTPNDSSSGFVLGTNNMVWGQVSGGGGSGGDEVSISATDPGAAYELWVDTTTPNLANPDVARWNSAWGVVDRLSSSDVAVAGTTTTVRSLPVTLITGRRYVARIRSSNTYFSGVVGDTFTINCLLDGTMFDSFAISIDVNNNYIAAMDVSLDFVASTGAHTVAVQVVRNSGTGTMQARWSLAVEDCGPVSMSSPPPVQMAPWTAVTFQNAWANLDAGRAVRYRLWGDVVQIQGCMTGGTLGYNTPAFTLPVGFRPRADTVFITPMSGGMSNLYVSSVGVVSCSAAAGSSGTNGFVYLDGATFQAVN